MLEPSLEPTINSRKIYRGIVVSLRVDEVRLPEGLETIREVVEHSDAVAVAPIDTNGNIVMVRQYRKAVEQKLLKCLLEVLKRENYLRRPLAENFKRRLAICREYRATG